MSERAAPPLNRRRNGRGPNLGHELANAIFRVGQAVVLIDPEKTWSSSILKRPIAPNLRRRCERERCRHSERHHSQIAMGLFSAVVQRSARRDFPQLLRDVERLSRL